MPPGEPTGLLLERAVELMTPHLPEPPPTLLDAALRDAQAEAHRLGITGIHDVEGDARAGAPSSGSSAPDALRLRVLFHPPVASLAGAGPRAASGAAPARSGSGSAA